MVTRGRTNGGMPLFVGSVGVASEAGILPLAGADISLYASNFIIDVLGGLT